MLVDILGGSQLGPGEGWFRKAVARTRHDWEATRARFDGDGDGRVVPRRVRRRPTPTSPASIATMTAP